MKLILIIQFLWMVTSSSSQNEQRKFPNHFTFGSASSAYQVEGAWNVDGKGPSIWDIAMHQKPNNVTDGSTGDDTAKSYTFFQEDIKALKDMGMNFYRFSISWSRILPYGETTNINEVGLKYYDTLINELIKNGIEPVVTLYHFDLPQVLQNFGGWTNPLIVDYFMLYVETIFERYADRVKTWITFNEGITFCEGGYGNPWEPPFVLSPGVGVYLCGHHVLIAHAKTYHLYRQKYFNVNRGRIGMSVRCEYAWPKNTSDQGDIAAADRALQFSCGWFGHPIFSKKGGYPDVMVNTINRKSSEEGRPWSRLPVMDDGLKEYIRGTSDFWGLNYYSGRYAEQSTNYGEPSINPSYKTDQEVDLSVDPLWPQAKTDWLYSIPDGLRQLLKWIKDQYNNPDVLITENGWSDDGELEDLGRIEYLTNHLKVILDAIYEDGCNVIGHTTWSVIDNFEWMNGFTQKFGLYHVDFNDPERNRTAKKSSKVIAEVIKSRVISEET